MQSIDNSGVLDYLGSNKNTLAAAVSIVFNDSSVFTSVPTVAFSGGSGTGAAGTAVLTNGRLTSITITNAGSGYSTAPTIAITGGGGSGATAVATVAGGAVTAIAITNAGVGKSILVTDNTSYPSGDSRSSVNIEVFDHYRSKVSTAIKSGTTTQSVSTSIALPAPNSEVPTPTTVNLLASSSNSVLIDIQNLNLARGLAMEVTVVSTLRKHKTSNVFKIGNTFNQGNLTFQL